MSFEVEVKFRVDDHRAILGRLEAAGAVAGEPIRQEDTYFNHPSRDFALTNEAFRIRREGPRSFLTYKGPRLDGPTKTRPEFEVPAGSGPEEFEALRAILLALGFREVATVRKVREPLRLDRDGRAFSLGLDDAGPLGLYVEVETIATAEHDLAAAQEAVQALGRDLGLSAERLEPRSYLRMTLIAQGLLPG